MQGEQHPLESCFMQQVASTANSHMMCDYHLAQLLEELPARVAGLYSSDPKDQHEAVHWFRKLLQAGGK